MIGLLVSSVAVTIAKYPFIDYGLSVGVAEAADDKRSFSRVQAVT